jgi:hypothetical protein
MGPGVRGAYKERLKKPWIEAFRKLGFIHQACEAVKISRKAVLEWRQNDPAFRDAFNEAEQRLTEMLEQSALQRALVGEKRGVYHDGKVVGNEMQKSDTLTIFLLKARDRKKYGDRMIHDVQIRFASGIVAEVMKALRLIPTTCPHCKTRMDVKENVGKFLIDLSRNFEAQESAT